MATDTYQSTSIAPTVVWCVLFKKPRNYHPRSFIFGPIDSAYGTCC